MSDPLRSSSETNPAVLIVDADEDTRDLYRESFGRLGWSVEEASDGRIALVRALAVKPSAIVTELRLPLIDGIALCEIVRRDSSTARLNVERCGGTPIRGRSEGRDASIGVSPDVKHA